MKREKKRDEVLMLLCALQLNGMWCRVSESRLFNHLNGQDAHLTTFWKWHHHKFVIALSMY